MNQDWVLNLQGPAQNENAGPPVKRAGKCITKGTKKIKLFLPSVVSLLITMIFILLFIVFLSKECLIV